MNRNNSIYVVFLIAAFLLVFSLFAIGYDPTSIRDYFIFAFSLIGVLAAITLRFKPIRKDLTNHKTTYQGYVIITFLFLIVTYMYFRKDFNQAQDVLHIKDIWIIIPYQIISFMVLPFLIIRESFKNRSLYNHEQTKTTVVLNLVIPTILITLGPLFYILFNLENFQNLYSGQHDFWLLTTFSDLVGISYLIGIPAMLITAYFYHLFNKNSPKV